MRACACAIACALGACACSVDLADLPGRVADDSHADFSAGSLSGAGAKLYVSARGTVQVAERLDVNQDGYIDVALANLQGASAGAPASSYIYLGTGTRKLHKRLELPTVGGSSAALADIDDDGQVDVAFSNFWKDGDPDVASYVYWGAKGGLSTGSRTELPTLGAAGCVVADLDRDGYLDLVFPCSFKKGAGHRVSSQVYWGGAGGLDSSRRTGLPTVGALDAAVADLDGDGHLDIVFANQQDGGKVTGINSYIYWGAGGGLDASRRTELPTEEASGVTVADLDGDGYLEVVFAAGGVHLKAAMTTSLIYWGSGGRGYSVKSRTPVQTVVAFDVAAADLDRDGHLDLVFANKGWQDDFKVSSYIYWGPWIKGAATHGKPAQLPAEQAMGVMAADLDRDGHLDLVFAASVTTGAGGAVSRDSIVYWGPWAPLKAGGTSPDSTLLASVSAAGTVAVDPGAVADRKGRYHLVSRVLDTGRQTPIYGLLSCTATVPARTALTFQLRSAAARPDLDKAPWLGPTGPGDAYGTSPASITSGHHDGHRYVQYRAVFDAGDAGTSPALDRVEISFR